MNQSQAAKPVKQQRPEQATTHSFSIRVHKEDSNKFAAWCDRHRLSYREGFDLLVPFLDSIDLSKR